MTLLEYLIGEAESDARCPEGIELYEWHIANPLWSEVEAYVQEPLRATSEVPTALEVAYCRPRTIKIRPVVPLEIAPGIVHWIGWNTEVRKVFVWLGAAD